MMLLLTLKNGLLKLPITVLAFFFSTVLFAQVPGYMGLKTSIYADIGGTFAYAGPTVGKRGIIHGSGSAGNKIGFSTRYGGGIQHVISRRKLIYFGADHITTGLPASFLGTQGWNDQIETFSKLSSTTLMFGYKRFNTSKGGLAPMGAYTGFDIQYSLIKGEITERERAIDPFDQKTGMASIGMCGGYSNVLFDRLLLDISIKYTVPLIKGFGVRWLTDDPLNFSNISPSDSDFNTKSFNYLAKQRLGSHSLLMIHVGLGILLF